MVTLSVSNQPNYVMMTNETRGLLSQGGTYSVPTVSEEDLNRNLCIATYHANFRIIANYFKIHIFSDSIYYGEGRITVFIDAATWFATGS